jgi:hypothetical protein
MMLSRPVLGFVYRALERLPREAGWSRAISELTESWGIPVGLEL